MDTTADRDPDTDTRLLSDDQLAQVTDMLPTVDSVELKLTIPDGDHRSTVAELGMDVMRAQLRQVTFFDTPDLALNRAGVLVRARRIQGRPGDTVVKLRPVVPSTLPAAVRESKAFGIEVDVMPSGFVRSGSMKASVGDRKLRELLRGERPLERALTAEQRSFWRDHAPAALTLTDLLPLGPVTVLKLKFRPPHLDRPMVAELWLFPDGSRTVELSTKCTPSEAFSTARETRTYLAGHGISMSTPQQTKTRTALRYFARRASGSESQAQSLS